MPEWGIEPAKSSSILDHLNEFAVSESCIRCPFGTQMRTVPVWS